MMMFAFFLAFLSGVWLLALPCYWWMSSPAERKGVQERMLWYQSKPFWPFGLLKILFVILNAWSLFPLRGMLVAIFLIVLFWLLPP